VGRDSANDGEPGRYVTRDPAESLRLNDIEPTEEIAQRRATERTGVLFDNDATVLIGDTPRDVEAGLVANVRVIGVATGKTSTQELRDVGAHHIATNLAECHVILNRMTQDISNACANVSPRSFW
jgi:phosphoglycolate phosphatase-like HAD superfamily hydrolase